VKQRLAKQLLQRADLLTDGRLGEVQLLGRLMKAAGLAAASKPRSTLRGGQCLNIID
jgi:hypothetical protein